MKKWFQKLLKSIEEANKQSFGNQKLDCCDLNKNNGKGNDSQQKK
ncbi:LDCC motif putative metal-binding protein [Alkaliphilus oremlandii]|nr:LDCC motif putative metal-binding protein [Alkaliphilus oremlandii]